MLINLDIIIPSFRLDMHYLQGIFRLPKPENLHVTFYIIADNPHIDLPVEIKQMADQKEIHLIVNPKNMGFSTTRNIGLDAGSSEWILFLDDDIVPHEDLLFVYAEAIQQKKDSIGFIGVTEMPPPFNVVTRALEIQGVNTHFKSAKTKDTLAWAPTANLVLNRASLAERKFDAQLIYGGEDIEFLTRNAFANQSMYTSVPSAIVTHPWWNGGRNQINRLFRYGRASANLLDKPHLKPYTYLDFTNTSESIVLLSIVGLGESILAGTLLTFQLIFCVLLAEILTQYFRTWYLYKTPSLGVWIHLLVHKNAFEAGALYESMRAFQWTKLMTRLDVGFKKVNPSPFRLNKWKIIKICLIIILFYLIAR
jgi:glycosyltransferase involved in cell wall biosynthesis